MNLLVALLSLYVADNILHLRKNENLLQVLKKSLQVFLLLQRKQANQKKVYIIKVRHAKIKPKSSVIFFLFNNFNVEIKIIIFLGWNMLEHKICLQYIFSEDHKLNFENLNFLVGDIDRV